jgi:hypothetical protein
MKPIPVFIGYDPREAVAYHTCANSIIRHASRPVAIIPLALNLFEDYKKHTLMAQISLSTVVSWCHT